MKSCIEAGRRNMKTGFTVLHSRKWKKFYKVYLQIFLILYNIHNTYECSKAKGCINWGKIIQKYLSLHIHTSV